MWLAKPISSLTGPELSSWKAIEAELPLAQTLAWAQATETLHYRAYLVFDAAEKVGGIVFSKKDDLEKGEADFECINGPFLHWDVAEKAASQISIFALAVSKLDRRFRSLRLKPRWQEGHMTHRMSLLPLELYGSTSAATVVVAVQESDMEQSQGLKERLRRSIRRALARGASTRWEKPNVATLERFVARMRVFAEGKNFTVPPLVWFQSLTQDAWICSAGFQRESGFEAHSQILVYLHGSVAHYLFGYDTRDSAAGSAVSTAPLAHWRALRECAALGIQSYDLNGYVLEATPDDPYYGVCRFKEQFGGVVVKYECPEFLIGKEK